MQKWIVCTTSLKNTGQCRLATARQLAKRNHEYLRSRPTAARGAPARRLASNTVQLKHACSGCQTRIIHRLDVSKLILISALVVKNASAKVRMVRFSTAVHGMPLRWCPPKTGRRCTAFHFPMLHRRHRPQVSGNPHNPSGFRTGITENGS